ncbi:glycogen synthase GlgA [Tropicimonas isoalkanivorans]|uniref:Glycogen synthase n=1 Tax=Tropicimonas isoalkanivorans TaxID=441112 RepID=A0A1I1P535_9RHOB|nr:glycogen synthase GlgA [Tropicimonas isoalkanivorans]SFD05051.1 starch synthase [Tropicimonas isoalkanivorans]
MKVLSVASEVAPLIKTGGLADVAGALPAALKPAGVDMRTLVPGYPAVLSALGPTRQILTDGDLFGGPVQILYGEAAGLELYVLDAAHLFYRDGGPYAAPDGYDWWDNTERFAALCWMAARLCNEGHLHGWKPDVLQAHDWQGGFAPVYLQRMGAAHSVGSVMTIHNIAFTGSAGADMIPRLRLPAEGYNAGGYEFYGRISALKAGIAYADKVNTVSPTYAEELKTPHFGMGFDGALQFKGKDFSGILNGIDLDVWNPATDPNIVRYKNVAGKAKARAALVEEMELDQGAGPLCVIVSRLTEQKGLDLLLDALPRLLERGGQLALLGSGDPWLQERFIAAAEANPGRVAVRLGYNEPLSHRLIAGGDAILVPSRFEPCGLTQLYGLRYGTVPVVALTGGLADTVIPATVATRAAGVATGIQFASGDAGALLAAIDRLCDLYQTREAFQQVQRNGMKFPVGWDTSAAAYAALFAEAAKHP